jgi:hypothetical protein
MESRPTVWTRPNGSVRDMQSEQVPTRPRVPDPAGDFDLEADVERSTVRAPTSRHERGALKQRTRPPAP